MILNKLSKYYHEYLVLILGKIIPDNYSIVEFGSSNGEITKSLKNKKKIFIKNENKEIVFFKKNKIKFDYIILTNKLSSEYDIQTFLKKIKKISHSNTKVIVLYFNFIWKPFLDFAEKFGLKEKTVIEPNWLSSQNIDSFFSLENFELVKNIKFFLFPIYVPVISNFVNKYLSRLVFLNNLCLMNASIYRINDLRKQQSVSIVIPARNESGHMTGVLKKIPKIGSRTEIIFVEGNSKDDTYDVIKSEIKGYKGKYKCKLYKQLGKGKGDAVRLGFSKAKGDILMILDADLTVDPKELPKFYDAYVEGKGDFIMGSRLIYPMEKQAMRTLNIFGNKFFSVCFSFLLDQKINDTLCGTKVISQSAYRDVEANRNYFGEFDPFGDYDLIFGANRLNLKILEIPIRYKQRIYGQTNISRFTHGWLLFKMVLFAAMKIKFI